VGIRVRIRVRVGVRVRVRVRVSGKKSVHCEKTGIFNKEKRPLLFQQREKTVIFFNEEKRPL
jgi:hypothetical protein